MLKLRQRSLNRKFDLVHPKSREMWRGFSRGLVEDLLIFLAIRIIELPCLQPTSQQNNITPVSQNTEFYTLYMVIVIGRQAGGRRSPLYNTVVDVALQGKYVEL